MNRVIHQSKKNLIDKLKKRNLFWSYDQNSVGKTIDSEVIQKVMLYGDIDELSALLSLYPISRLKQEWSKLFIENTQYKRESVFVANYLFGGIAEL